MKNLGRVDGEQISALISRIESVGVNEVGILMTPSRQFEIRRLRKSSTFVLRSKGTGVANGSSTTIAEAVVLREREQKAAEERRLRWQPN